MPQYFDINLHTVVVWFRLQRLQCFLILNKFRTLNTTDGGDDLDAK